LNLCTTDSCNATTGCVFTQIDCSDGNPCTDDFCSPNNGSCFTTPTVVPAGNLCAGTYCDPVLGIVTVPTTCPSACDYCDPLSGCANCPGDFGVVEQVATGLGAAAIVGIAIGIAAFVAVSGVGAKKGYDYWVRNHGTIGDVRNNPLYTRNPAHGTNPLYDPTPI